MLARVRVHERLRCRPARRLAQHSLTAHSLAHTQGFALPPFRDLLHELLRAAGFMTRGLRAYGAARHADEAAREAKRARHAAPRLALESGHKKIAAAVALAAAAEAEAAERAEGDAAAAAAATATERLRTLREREVRLEARAAARPELRQDGGAV